jgi:hypothetical protein
VRLRLILLIRKAVTLKPINKERSESDDEDDEDMIENKALEKKMKENKKEPSTMGKIASMISELKNKQEESITESGSLGLKKSQESDDYKISSSNDDIFGKK